MSEAGPIIIGIGGSNDGDKVAGAISSILGASFEGRNSSHYGGDYYLARVERPESIRLFPNLDPLEGTAYYETTAEFPFVLRLQSSNRDVEDLVVRIAGRLGSARRIR